jgi:hypothetical protein
MPHGARAGIDDVVTRFADIMTPKGANALLTQASLYCAVRDACDQKAKLADALPEPVSFQNVAVTERYENVKTLLEHASGALVGTEAGWHSGEVSKFQVIVNVPSQRVSDPTTAAACGSVTSIRSAC